MERYQLGPGQAERFGTPLMNLPKIDQVEQVCNGEPRTAKLRVTTASEYEVEYELTYALDEPAKQIESDQDDLYVCESGEIQSFERIDTDSA